MTGSLREAVAAAKATRPVLVFLAGPNGAGKSTFHRAYLDKLGLPFVNADVFAKALREAGRTSDADREAFSKAEGLRRTLVEGRVSFCTESVFSDVVGAKLELLKQARSLGFAVFLGARDRAGERRRTRRARRPHRLAVLADALEPTCGRGARGRGVSVRQQLGR